MLLLERDSQLSTLARWHDSTLTGGGCVVLVTGEAGIGKSTLVHEFVRRRGNSVRPLWGACDPLSTPQPLGPLRDVSRQVGGALLKAMADGMPRERIFTTVLDELERATERVLFIIEDMHWADEASLDLLKYLGRRIARTRSMLIVTYRNDEVDARHPLASAIGHLPGGVVQRLPLPSLSEAAVAELAEDSGRKAEGLHAATNGNPFYVTEVLATEAGEVPASVRDAVLARIGRLSEGARKVAELAALVPGRVEPWLVQAVLRTDEETLDECTLSGMTRHSDGTLAFRHELSRRALEDSLTPVEAKALHAQILHVLANSEWSEVSESRLVHHAVGAGDIDAVLRYAPLAGERAASVSAHREAIAYYRTALMHGDRLDPVTRARLLDRLSYECYLTGLIDGAIDASTKSLTLWRGAGNAIRVGDTLRWLSRFSWFTGHGDRSDRFAMQAIETLEPLGQTHELAMAYSNLSQLGMLSDQMGRSIEWGERAIALARQLGSQDILAHALNNVGGARFHRVGDAGWREMQQSLDVSLLGGFQEHVARAYTNLFSFALNVRDYVTASTYLEAGLAYCDEHDLDAWGQYMRAFRARARFEQASWSDAAMDAETLLAQPGIATAAKLPALLALGRVRTRRGDDNPDAPLHEAYAYALETREPQRICPVTSACAELAWLRGDMGTALRESQIGLEVALRGDDNWRRSEATFWNWRAGANVVNTETLTEPYRLHIEGDFLGAAKAWAMIGCRYEEAVALADSPDDGHRRRALEIFDGLGAKPMARRLRKQLQAEGVRGLKRGANRATRSNPAGLTSRELEILALLAGNLSNADIARKLFLSTKTVGHHASAILQKLGIASRREAAMAARKLGIELDESA
jgi:DNA-binding CsgD family transcriptional regulator